MVLACAETGTNEAIESNLDYPAAVSIELTTVGPWVSNTLTTPSLHILTSMMHGI